MRSFIICFFLVFSVHGKLVFAQQGQMIMPLYKTAPVSGFLYQNKTVSHFFPTPDTVRHLQLLPRNYLPQNFYSTNMGAICKVELGMQKQIKFPLFIRLGSKDYTDKMEGKLLQRR